MDAAAFDYDLPETAIAQRPAEPRSSARLLVDRGPGESPDHRTVADLPGLLGPGDLVVVNDSRVRPARLRLRKPSGGAVEVLLLEQGPEGWEALVRPSRRVLPGTVLTGDALRVEVGAEVGDGRRRVRLLDASGDAATEAMVESEGEVPLPPYVHTPLVDPERYQTTFAEQLLHDGRPGDLRSAAAPTAGLHLTPDVLDRCRAAGATVAAVRLAVGVGTFRPITAHQVEQHRMHEETFVVPGAVLDACTRARRVVAVGTTVVRALESAATGRAGTTDLFIHGDHEFAVVDVLLTNFHVPRSSLLVLVDAFVGPRWRALYADALAHGYRFLSLGDALLLDRRWGRA